MMNEIKILKDYVNKKGAHVIDVELKNIKLVTPNLYSEVQRTSGSTSWAVKKGTGIFIEDEKVTKKLQTAILKVINASDNEAKREEMKDRKISKVTWDDMMVPFKQTMPSGLKKERYWASPFFHSINKEAPEAPFIFRSNLGGWKGATVEYGEKLSGKLLVYGTQNLEDYNALARSSSKYDVIPEAKDGDLADVVFSIKKKDTQMSVYLTLSQVITIERGESLFQGSAVVTEEFSQGEAVKLASVEELEESLDDPDLSEDDTVEDIPDLES